MRNRGAQILWLGILLAFVIAMGALLIGGYILLYLSPRMVPIVWFGFIVMSVLSVYQLGRIISGPAGQERKIHLGYLVFLIPIVLILTVTPNENTSAVLPNQNVKLVNMLKNTADNTVEDDTGVLLKETAETLKDTEQTEQNSLSTPSPIKEEAKTTEQADIANTILASDAVPCVLKDETVPFDDDTDSFSEFLSPEELADKAMMLCGFVYKDDLFPKNTVLISRLFISCCAADASIVGFHVKVENTDVFKDDDWICVQGKMEVMTMEYAGEPYDVPILTGGIITHCEAPDAEDAYIYS